ncbi:DUF2344 domain-containing protein [candidate division WOR-3 bacterium]|nr:DUF2344 domain-containing protein [candidate division WOR-3 bacterium]
MVKSDSDEIFSRVEHPTRYINGEFNSPKSEGNPLVLLSYPDLYELGMSNLGIQILSHILNKNGYGTERVFSPAIDLERELIKADLPLLSLESGTPACEFPVLGFSLECELDATNMINILVLAGIPVNRNERSEGMPVVIAGGSSALNPSPWSHFIDAFVAGEAEDVILEIGKLAGQYRKKNIGRSEFIKELSRLKGVFAPDYPENEALYLRVDRLRREDAPVPSILPFMRVIHDRQVVEISRGCSRTCKFCQAGCVSRNTRHRSAEDVVYIAKKGLQTTGWEELSLLSLSVSDHPELDRILVDLFPYLKKNNISLSLPSLRADSISEETLKTAGILGHRTLTLAPEAGNESLRFSIGKIMKDEDIFSSVEKAVKNGFNRVKFYFMVGLPGEKDSDIHDIVRIVKELFLAMKLGKPKVSIAPFVPRPHTPFEAIPQAAPEEVTEKYKTLSDRLSKIRRFIHFRDPKAAAIEGIIARGDERISSAALSAFKAGARFDQWRETFSYEIWQKSLEESGIDMKKELKSSPCAPERWAMIKIEKETPTKIRPSNFPSAKPEIPIQIWEIKEDVVFYYRLKYSKDIPLRFLSHLELTSAVLRSLKRAGVKIPYSKGKRPKPLVNYGPPLPCGIVSKTELLDFSSKEPLKKDFLSLSEKHFPCGIGLLDLFVFGQQPSPITSSELEIKYLCRGAALSDEKIKNFLSDDECFIDRNTSGREKKVNLRKFVLKIEKTDYGVIFSVLFGKNGSARPSELAEYFNIQKNLIWERTEINPR